MSLTLPMIQFTYMNAPIIIIMHMINGKILNWVTLQKINTNIKKYT